MEKEKFFIVLYGNRNQGKSTSLRKLVFLLGGGSASLKSDIEKALLKSKSYKDARFIVEYNGHNVFIATGGDAWVGCRGNTDFFEGNINGKHIVFRVYNNTIVELTTEEKKHFKDKPTVVVCACRPKGDSCGAIKAIHSYSETHLIDYAEQVWIKRDRSIEPDSKKVAEDLKKRIDNYLTPKKP